MRNKFLCMGMVIFLITFFFYLFHTQSLPFDVSADGVLWLHRGYEKSWSSIAKQIFLERGDYQNERNSFENRPAHVLVFKVILSLFGFDPRHFYLYMALMIGLISVVILIFANACIKNKFLVFIAPLFLMTIPPVFYVGTWITDIDLVVQLLTSFILLLFLFHFFQRRASLFKNVLLQMSMFFLFLFAFNAKENAIIVPIIMTMFILVTDWRQFKRYILLLLSLYYIILPSGIGKGNFDVVYIVRMLYFLLFRSPVSPLGNEDISALFSPLTPLKVVPNSVASILGFFLLWSFFFAVIYVAKKEKWFAGILSFLKKFKIGNNLKKVGQEECISMCLTLFAIWFIAGIFLAVLTTLKLPLPPAPASRFLFSPFIPLILLIFLIFDKFINLFKKPKKTIFTFMIILIILFSLIVNTYNSGTRVRNCTGSIRIMLKEAVDLIYKDVYGYLPEGYLFGAFNYCCPDIIKIEEIVLSDLSFYNNTKSINDLNIQKKFEKYQRIYLISYGPLPEIEQKYSVISRIQLPLYNNSLYYKIKKIFNQLLNKQSKSPYYLYSIEE